MSDVSDQLAHAPKHVQLAIDLIMLLEQHELDPADVIAALEIIKTDFIQKQLTSTQK